MNNQLKSKSSNGRNLLKSLAPKTTPASFASPTLENICTATGVGADATYQNVGPQHKWWKQIEGNLLEPNVFANELNKAQKSGKVRQFYVEWLEGAAVLLHYYGRQSDELFQEWAANVVLGENDENGESVFSLLSEADYAAIAAVAAPGCTPDFAVEHGKFLKDYWTQILPLQLTLNSHMYKKLNGKPGVVRSITQKGKSEMFINLLARPTRMGCRGGGITYERNSTTFLGVPNIAIFGYFNAAPKEQGKFMMDGLNIPSDGRYLFTKEYLDKCNEMYGVDKRQEKFYKGKAAFGTGKEMVKAIFYPWGTKPRFPLLHHCGMLSVGAFIHDFDLTLIYEYWDITGSEDAITQIRHLKGLVIYPNINLKEHPFLKFLDPPKHKPKDDDNNSNNSSNQPTPSFNKQRFFDNLTIDEFEEEVKVWKGEIKRGKNMYGTDITEYMDDSNLQYWRLQMKRDIKAGLEYQEEKYQEWTEGEQNNKNDQRRSQLKTIRSGINPTNYPHHAKDWQPPPLKKSNNSSNDTSDSDSSKSDIYAKFRGNDLTLAQIEEKEGLTQKNTPKMRQYPTPPEPQFDNDPWAASPPLPPSNFVSPSLSPTPNQTERTEALKKWRDSQAKAGKIISKHYWDKLKISKIIDDNRKNNIKLTLWTPELLKKQVEQQTFLSGDIARFEDNDASTPYCVISQSGGDVDPFTMEMACGKLSCAPITNDGKINFDARIDFDLFEERVKRIDERFMIGSLSNQIQVGHILTDKIRYYAVNLPGYVFETEDIKYYETLVEEDTYCGKLHYSMKLTENEIKTMYIAAKLDHQLFLMTPTPQVDYFNMFLGHHTVAPKDKTIYGSKKYTILKYNKEDETYTASVEGYNGTERLTYESLVKHQFQERPYMATLSKKYGYTQTPPKNASLAELAKVFDQSATDGNFYRNDPIEFAVWNQYMYELIENEVSNVMDHDNSNISVLDSNIGDNTEKFTRLFAPHLNQVRDWGWLEEDRFYYGDNKKGRLARWYNFNDKKGVLDNAEHWEQEYLNARNKYLDKLQKSDKGKETFVKLTPLNGWAGGIYPTLKEINKVKKDLRKSEISDDSSDNVTTKNKDEDDEEEDDDINMNEKNPSGNARYIESKNSNVSWASPKSLVWSPAVEDYLTFHIGETWKKWLNIERKWFRMYGIAEGTGKPGEKNGVMFHKINMKYEKVINKMADINDSVRNSTSWIEYDKLRREHKQAAIEYDKKRAKISNTTYSFFRVFDTSNAELPLNVGMDHISNIVADDIWNTNNNSESNNNNNNNNANIILEPLQGVIEDEALQSLDNEMVAKDKSTSADTNATKTQHQAQDNVLPTFVKHRQSQASSDSNTVTDKSPDINTLDNNDISNVDSPQRESKHQYYTLEYIKRLIYREDWFKNLQKLFDEISHIPLECLFATADAKQCERMIHNMYFNDCFGVCAYSDNVYVDPSINASLWANNQIEEVNVTKVGKWMVAACVKIILQKSAAIHCAYGDILLQKESNIRNQTVKDLFVIILGNNVDVEFLNKCYSTCADALQHRAKDEDYQNVWIPPVLDNPKMFSKCYGKGDWVLNDISKNSWDVCQENVKGRSEYSGIECYMFRQGNSFGQINDTTNKYNVILCELSKKAEELDDIDIGLVPRDVIDRIKHTLDVGDCKHEFIKHAKPLLDYQNELESKKLWIPFKRCKIPLQDLVKHDQSSNILAKLVNIGEVFAVGVQLREWLESFANDEYASHCNDWFADFLIKFNKNECPPNHVGTVATSQAFNANQDVKKRYKQEVKIVHDKHLIDNTNENVSNAQEQVNKDKNKNVNDKNKIKDSANVNSNVKNVVNKETMAASNVNKNKNKSKNVVNEDVQRQAKEVRKQHTKDKHKGKSNSKNVSALKDKPNNENNAQDWRERWYKFQNHVRKYNIGLYQVSKQQEKVIDELQNEIIKLNPGPNLNEDDSDKINKKWYELTGILQKIKIGQSDGQVNDLIDVEEEVDDMHDSDMRLLMTEMGDPEDSSDLEDNDIKMNENENVDMDAGNAANVDDIVVNVGAHVEHHVYGNIEDGVGALDEAKDAPVAANGNAMNVDDELLENVNLNVSDYVV